MVQNKKGGLQALTAAAQQKAEQVKNIKSVVPTEDKVETIVQKSDVIEKVEEQKEIVSPEDIKEVVLPEKKDEGIDYFFEEKKILQSETVRIPVDMHKQLKLLSLISKVPITNIVTNIISKELAGNSKTIQNYIKKNL